MIDIILKTFKTYRKSLVDIALLLFAFFSAVSISPIVRLPFSNPQNISNQLNETGFNPDNNYLSLLFIIVSTIVGWLVMKRLYISRFSWLIKVIAIFVLVINFSFTTVFDGQPGYADSFGKADQFHSGEQMSPTNDFLKGKNLYSELFFLRGAGVDVLFPALGFSVFGTSIGSFLLMSDIMLILGLMGFLVLLAFLIRNPIVYWIVSLFFFSSAAVSILEFRDIIVWTYIGLVFLLFQKNIKPMYRYTLLSGLGGIAGLSMYLSIDRGIVLLITTIVLFSFLALFKRTSQNQYNFAPKLALINIKTSLLLPAGLIAGLLLPLPFIGIAGFVDFIKMSFFEIPRYGGLLVSQPFPPLSTDTLLFWAPVFLSIVAGYLLYSIHSIRESRNYNYLIPLSVLFVIAVLFIKIGSNRIALAKLATATAPLYLLIFLLILLGCIIIVNHKRARYTLLLPTALSLVTVVAFSQLQLNHLVQQPQSSLYNIKQYLYSVRLNDDHWVSEEASDVKAYIQSVTAPSDSIFSFTSDPFYYYLSDRKNSSRFYITWYTDPQPYTNELLQELKDNPPALIVYSNNTWTDAPDNVPIKDRIPEVNNWILENYPTKKTIGTTTLLTP